MSSKPPFGFYLLLFISGVLLVMASGFFFTSWAGVQQLSREAFSTVCHQFMSRSFSGNEAAMAVCSRCFGIYAGFFSASLLGLMVRKYITLKLTAALALCVLAAVLNLADVAGNLLGFWTNTLSSRFLAGLFAGGTFILIIFSAEKKH